MSKAVYDKFEDDTFSGKIPQLLSTLEPRTMPCLPNGMFFNNSQFKLLTPIPFYDF